MTQHQLNPLPEYSVHKIIVGWRTGNCTPTFYATSVNLTADACPDDCRAHIVAPIAPKIITDPRIVIEIVRPYAEIPPGLLAALKADQAAAPGPGEQILQINTTTEP